MKILICGGRNYSNTHQAFKDLDEFHKEHNVTEVIHGGARGADSIGGHWAELRNIPVTVYPAQWDKYGKSAGYRRNHDMATHGKPDAVLAFPGGRGTQHMIDIANKMNITVYEQEK